MIERELAATVAREERETRLAADLREGRFVTSVQVDPPLGANYEGLLEVAAAVATPGSAAYVDINDNATARVGMHPLIVVGRDRAAGSGSRRSRTSRRATRP